MVKRQWDDLLDSGDIIDRPQLRLPMIDFKWICSSHFNRIENHDTYDELDAYHSMLITIPCVSHRYAVRREDDPTGSLTFRPRFLFRSRVHTAQGLSFDLVDAGRHPLLFPLVPFFPGFICQAGLHVSGFGSHEMLDQEPTSMSVKRVASGLCSRWRKQVSRGCLTFPIHAGVSLEQPPPLATVTKKDTLCSMRRADFRQ